METLYSRIQALAKEQGLTGIQLGKLLDLSKSPLTDWKNGKSKPTLEQLLKLCEIFAVSADYLLFGKQALGLSDDENNLITKYRKLDSSEKNDASRYINYILDNKDATDKQSAFPQGQSSSTSKHGKKSTASSEETA